MIYVILEAAVIAYGVWYARDPMPSLKRKYGNDEVPELAKRTARIVGIVTAAVGAAALVTTLVKML